MITENFLELGWSTWNGKANYPLRYYGNGSVWLWPIVNCLFRSFFLWARHLSNDFIDRDRCYKVLYNQMIWLSNATCITNFTVIIILWHTNYKLSHHHVWNLFLNSFYSYTFCIWLPFALVHFKFIAFYVSFKYERWWYDPIKVIKKKWYLLHCIYLKS